MPISNYPFISVERISATKARITVKGPNARPRLWIRITNPDKNCAFEVPAIIDTGADACAFPAKVASQLGHVLKSVPHKTIHTAKGPTFAYPHTTKIEILDVQPNGLPKRKVLYTIPETTIDFTEGLPEFLLGRKEFLNKFILKIDYPNQVFSIRWPQVRQHKKKRKRKKR